MYKNLKSNRGVFLSLVTYPILILAVGYAAISFVSAINGNNQTKIALNSIQAQYNAYKGIEYAALEIINQGATPFMTHIVGANEALNTNTGVTLTPKFGGVITAQNIYYLSLGTNSSASVKTYTKNNQVFILARGSSNNRERLFAHKVSGNSLYDYFFFFPRIPNSDYVSLGWQTFDAQGAKIHANTGIRFSEGAKFYNVKEFSTEGAIAYHFARFVYPGKENTYGGSRFPYWTPNDYLYSVPPIPPDTDGNGIPDNNIGNYINQPDGHNYGDRGNGLLTFDTGTNTYRIWKDATHQAETMKPIYPWPHDGSNWAAQTDGSGNLFWDPDSAAKYIRYKQNNINCGIAPNPGCANGTTNNANYYTGMTYINGVYLPNDLAGSPYPTNKYYSDSNEQMNLKLTNSDHASAFEAWDNFIAAYPKVVVNQTTITGLQDVVKAGPTRGGQYIAPPRLNIAELTEQAKDLGKGIVIEKNGVNIEVTINGGDANAAQGGVTLSMNDAANAEIKCPADTSLTVFKRKAFKNHETGKEDTIVEVDIKNLKDCDSGALLPSGGLIYSNYATGLGLANAERLPEGGLTSIVNGNVYLKGHYNYNASNTPGWTWQPSAVIMSNYTYVLSNDFTYPDTLPYTYRHPEYPYGGTYTCPADQAGLGCQTAGATYSINYGTASNDFTTGFNWKATYDSKMANKVVSGVNDSGVLTYFYDVSLIGRNGWAPKYLERWNYPSNNGTWNSAPSGSSSHKAVITGATVQLNDEFNGTVPLDYATARPCSSPPPGGYPAGYVCRNSPGSTWDLLASNGNPIRKYQTQYLSSPVRPPGPGIGYARAVLIELTNTNTNWTVHNALLTVPAS